MANNTKRGLDLGFTNAAFSGNYGFSIVYGPRRYVGIGVAVSDGRGRFRAIQKLNIGNGQPLLVQKIVGTYEVDPDGTGVAHVEVTLPDGNVVDGTFDYVVLRAEQRGSVKLGVELQGVDRNPAIDFSTGKPLEPPQIGVSWFQSIP